MPALLLPILEMSSTFAAVFTGNIVKCTAFTVLSFLFYTLLSTDGAGYRSFLKEMNICNMGMLFN